MRRPPPSLKARAIALLSQREHSAMELKRKLLRQLARQRRLAVGVDAGAAPAMALDRATHEPHDPHDRKTHVGKADHGAADGIEPNGIEPIDSQALADERDEASALDAGDFEAAQRLRVDEVVEWLRAHDHLNEDRFVESRLHAKAGRFGNLRLRQELAQHGLALPVEAAESLKASELERARAVWQRRYGSLTADAFDAAGRARQSRFLAARGFSADVIRTVLRGAPRAVATDAHADDEPA